METTDNNREPIKKTFLYALVSLFIGVSLITCLLYWALFGVRQGAHVSVVYSALDYFFFALTAVSVILAFVFRRIFN